MYGTPQGLDYNQQPIPFAAIVGRAHKVQTYAQVERPDGTVLMAGIGLLMGGDVTVDRTAQFRRSCRLDVSPWSSNGFVTSTTGMTIDQVQAAQGVLLPATPFDPLAPYGNLVRVFYGIEVPGQTSSLFGPGFYQFTLGAFRIANISISDEGAPSLTVTGYDRSRTVSRNKLTQPWLVTSGTNYGDAIIALVQDRDPTAPVRAHSVTDTTPAMVIDPEQDPWQVVSDWASAIGYEVFFDNDGYLVIRPEPDPTTNPIVWTYQDGGADANTVLLSVQKDWSDDPGYNGIVMTSESATITQPLRSEVWDMNPSSPTYSLGPYGKVPKFVSNPYIATQAQCDAAANAELLRSIGGTEQVSFAVVPNPAHEAGDVVQITRPLAKIDSTAVLQSFTVPLDVTSAMNITCTERRALQ